MLIKQLEIFFWDLGQYWNQGCSFARHLLMVIVEDMETDLKTVTYRGCGMIEIKDLRSNLT